MGGKDTHKSLYLASRSLGNGKKGVFMMQIKHGIREHTG